MDMNTVIQFMMNNRSNYDSAFDCAVDATSYYSLWENNSDICGGEYEIPQMVIEAAKKVFGDQF